MLYPLLIRWVQKERLLMGGTNFYRFCSHLGITFEGNTSENNGAKKQQQNQEYTLDIIHQQPGLFIHQ